MTRLGKATLAITLFVLIFLISGAFVSGQSISSPMLPTLSEDTSINPHHFTNEYYYMHGIVPKLIVERRNGVDKLSVLSPSSNPYHTGVRIIATLPGYDQDGQMYFWYQLGELRDYAFTADRTGVEMRANAKAFPIYVFPDMRATDETRIYAHTRQAALMDNSYAQFTGQDINKLGVREVLFVTYTGKAFTKDGFEMMDYLMKKNGRAADDTPLIKTIGDLRMLEKYDLVTTSPATKMLPRYAIVPTIQDPTNGVIAADAFLWYAMIDGKPLPSEEMFSWQFGCLRKTGTWCKGTPE